MKTSILNIERTKGILLSMLTAIATSTLCISQNYTKVYDALPDMTLDQAYSALINFQKANPYLANTYLQIGNVCEKKMIIYDPLRETNSVEYWAKNAILFYGNLKVYYTENDVRSEFYENIKIPYSGKRVTDEDLWKYVNERKQHCQNHCDSTLLIYAAIEGARLNYNKSIETYESICDEYYDMNEMLLRHDDKLAQKLNILKGYINKCEELFAEYKRLTKLYPIANYKQLYEKVPIETFRLDGLTNSDFFNNRVTICDYSAWIDNLEKTLNSHIIPLRKEVDKINGAYTSIRNEFSKGGIVTLASDKPYDEYFLFRLGHFDVGSIIESLFDYLDETRNLISMAGDSIGRDAGTDAKLERRKMRQLNRLSNSLKTAAEKREIVRTNATESKVARFQQFFDKEYGGLSGLKQFLDNDEAYCQSIIDEMSEATASYIDRAERQLGADKDTYSKAKDQSAPSLPLWVTLDPQSLTSKYVTTHISRNANGDISAVAGHQKGNARSWFAAGISEDMTTNWLIRLKDVNSVNSIKATQDGVLISAIRQLRPVIIYIDAQGKESNVINLDTELVDGMYRDDMTGSIVWFYNNSDEMMPCICIATEGSHSANLISKLKCMASVISISNVNDGYVITGLTSDGALATASMGKDGGTEAFQIICEGIESIKATQRVSANEMAVLARTSDGRHKYIPFKIK